MSAGLALLAALTPAEREDLLARHRVRKATARTKAAQRAEARARRTMLRSLGDPRLRAKVEAAKASGALIESLETPGLWFMGAYAENDPVRLYLHVTIGVVVGADGATFIEPWARPRR